MDKKQKKMLASIIVIIILIIILTGYTFAKYYTAYNTKTNAEVAKWSFNVNGWSNSETQLIQLINTANIVDLEDGKIAPGASGEFELELDASKSEVDVEYRIEAIESGNKPSNLVFSLSKDGITDDVQYSSIKELADAELKGIISKDDKDKVKTLKIVWNWPYETGTTEDEIEEYDKQDTNYGNGTVQNHENEFDYSFLLKIIGTQARI